MDPLHLALGVQLGKFLFYGDLSYNIITAKKLSIYGIYVSVSIIYAINFYTRDIQLMVDLRGLGNRGKLNKQPLINHSIPLIASQVLAYTSI